MNAQERMIDRRMFRTAAIAAAAVAVLVLAAYLFGNSLRADTPASLAPASVESSVAAVRKVGAVAPSILAANYTDSRGARTITSAARAAALAVLARSRSDFYADQNAAAEAARWAAVAANDKSHTVFYNAVIAANAAADAARSDSRAFLAKSRADFYADLNNSAAATDAYNQEWMGFTSPESVQPRLSNSPSLAIGQSASIKPEGIRPASQAGADQLPWIKPEGVKPPAAK
jgi:hypothetical protein